MPSTTKTLTPSAEAERMSIAGFVAEQRYVVEGAESVAPEVESEDPCPPLEGGVGTDGVTEDQRTLRSTVPTMVHAERKRPTATVRGRKHNSCR